MSAGAIKRWRDSTTVASTRVPNATRVHLLNENDPMTTACGKRGADRTNMIALVNCDNCLAADRADKETP